MRRLGILACSASVPTLDNKGRSVYFAFRSVVAAGILCLSLAAQAALTTGPTSPYYVSNYATGKILVLQGLQIVDSFDWAFPSDLGSQFSVREGVLTVSDLIRTREFYTPIGGSTPNAGGGAAYTLEGNFTGTTYNAPSPAGITNEQVYDATSDGVYNYYVQHIALIGGTHPVERVYRTNLDWSDPTILFTLEPSDTARYLGIAYDSDTDSIWISGWGTNYVISNYSMTGSLLHSFSTGDRMVDALAYDSADNTLWGTVRHTNTLTQFSLTGTLLQEGTIPGTNGLYLGGDMSPLSAAPVPVPGSLFLVGLGLVGMSFRSKRSS